MQEFREENNLQVISGNLLADSQASEMASQLIYAAAATADARARLESFEGLLARDAGEAAAVFATNTPSDSALAALRDDYLQTRREWRDIVAVRGEN